jgi:hypothetical protein
LFAYRIRLVTSSMSSPSCTLGNPHRRVEPGNPRPVRPLGTWPNRAADDPSPPPCASPWSANPAKPRFRPRSRPFHGVSRADRPHFPIRDAFHHRVPFRGPFDPAACHESNHDIVRSGKLQKRTGFHRLPITRLASRSTFHRSVFQPDAAQQLLQCDTTHGHTRESRDQ